MMTMLCRRRLASSSDCRATATGSPTPLPGSGAYTGIPARSPSTWSCCTALGRCRSAATSTGVLPCPFSHSASLAASVVLPDPCRPASMMTVGGTFANRSRLVSPPRMPTSSSCTILMTCCAGFSAAETSSPLARSLTRAMNCLTTGSATSASSRAMRISRVVASMSAADSRPRPRSAENTCVSRSDRVSNTETRLPVGPRSVVQDRLASTGPRARTSGRCRATVRTGAGSGQRELLRKLGPQPASAARTDPTVARRRSWSVSGSPSSSVT